MTVLALGASCQSLIGIDEDPDRERCPVRYDSSDSAALFAFENPLEEGAVDWSSTLIGSVEGSGMSQTSESMDGCGNALEFADDSTGHVLVAHDATLALPSGSLEFLLRTPDSVGFAGIISRDEKNQEPGELSIVLTPQGRLAARMQESAAWDILLCSQVLSLNEWHHVVLNFGDPVELYVDGFKADYDGQVNFTGSGKPCGPTRMLGLDGNRRDWIFGAYMNNEDEIIAHLQGAAIDEIHIRSTRYVQ